MSTRLRTAIFFIALVHSSSLLAQDFSNKGKDFWIGYGNHVRMFNGNPPEKMQLYITSDVATSGQVTISSIGFSQSFTITPNQITTIDIPRTAALMDDGLYDHGIHVTAGKPVVVYSFVYVNAISGATVCLPTNTLGRDYFSVNYTQRSNDPSSHSYFFVIAADTGTTTVEITPAATTKGGKPAGVPFLISLKQGQIYQVLGAVSGLTGEDLTGSRIRSMNTGAGCKRIAVFCGSGKVTIGCSSGTADNLYQQMYPTATWGKKYITVPSLVNSNNYYRIVKSDPSANVILNGVALNAGSFINNFYFEFSNTLPQVIESDKPILVAQYFTTQNCSGNGIGDPEMIYLNPIEQTISAVTLNSMQPPGIAVNKHYLNIVLKNDAAAINSFSLDGIAYNNFSPVPGDNGFVYTQIATTSGTHNIKCDTGFNIIAYGFGSPESYGFSGGTNLKDLYQYVSIKNKYAVVDYPATCTDAPFNFSMTFPYMPTKVQWKFNGLYTDELVDAPVPDSSWTKNGKQIYLYRLPKIYTGPQPGVYPIKIIATNPTIDGCTGEQEIDFDLQVYQKPEAFFNLSTGGCLGDSTFFTDQSVTGGNLPIKWSWDFGNGDVSALKNAAYLYKTTGSYTSSFSIVTQVGCLTDTVKKTVVINPVPTAAFTTTAPYCVGRDVLIKDASTITGGAITKWTWDMGDGQTLTKTSNAAFTYKYVTAGNYTISLITETDKGCKSKMFSLQVDVGAVPEVGFILPENCLSDPFSQFIDTSSIADGTQSSFIYSWNFGDANASPANNIATTKNPKHKYIATGDYNVSLAVISDKGCVDSIKQVFTVNGAVPQSLFSIDNGSEECSNKKIMLTNNSIVDVGKIVRLEIYWDYTNDPTNKTLDEDPQPGKKYSYQYPSFFTPASKNYTIQVVAYSGDNCLSTATKKISIKAIPELQFIALNPVCSDVTPFLITQATVINELSGNGIFSGNGVSSTGTFTPASATIGIDSIQYRFTAVNSCINTIRQAIEVYPLPKVNAGADRFLLEDGSLTLAATASGNNLKYLWAPGTALNSSTILQPVASPTDDIRYRLTVISAEGCKASDEVLVTVLKKPGVPNTFSPNGDGIHDRWEIKYLDTYPGATVEIYNRYGQLVFKSTGHTQSWDGTYNGKPVPVGTYYYIVNPKNGRKQVSGYVDIIR
jgi:gliding motility-associated-like protein